MKKSLAVLASCLLTMTLLASCAPATPQVSPSAAVDSPAPSAMPSPSVSATPAPVSSTAPSTAPAASQAPSASPAPGEAAADGVLSTFAATDLDGNDVDQSLLSDYGLTMVNVWATFCSPCLKEMPDLGAIHSEYADKGFQVVGLVSDVLDRDGSLNSEQVALAKDIVAQTKADYLHIVPSEDLYGILAEATAVPLTFFVDKDGNQVGYAYSGARSKADWIAIIDPLLAEVAK